MKPLVNAWDRCVAVPSQAQEVLSRVLATATCWRTRSREAVEARGLGGTLSLMADWSPLRSALRDVDHQCTFTWQDLDSLVGGLPASAYNYAAFWKGERTGWPGFTTVDVRVGRSVTFVRAVISGRWADASRSESQRERRGAAASGVRRTRARTREDR